MGQQVYFTVNGKRVQRIFEGGDVEFSFPYLMKVLSEADLQEGYEEYGYWPDVKVPIVSLMRYINGAGMEVISE